MVERLRKADGEMSEQLHDLHRAFLEIVSVINRPREDDTLLRRVGVKLDRGLFPLLVRIQQFGPIGVVDLADQVGRDYTTVSRQVARLERLGLVARRGSAHDGRIREARLTPKGIGVTGRIDGAREKLLRELLTEWRPQEVEQLVRSVRKLADTVVEQRAADSKSH